MAVKVIARKRIGAKKIHCDECGATLSYLPVDIKKYEGTDYSGGPDGRWWIVCPDCKNKVTLKSW